MQKKKLAYFELRVRDALMIGVLGALDQLYSFFNEAINI